MDIEKIKVIARARIKMSNNVFDINNFKTDSTPSWVRADKAYGGGHTVKTDPTKRGWKLRWSDKKAAALLGNSELKKCFIITEIVNDGNKGLDLSVSTYTNKSPKELWQKLQKTIGTDLGKADNVKKVKGTSGWAMDFVGRVSREVETDGEAFGL